MKRTAYLVTATALWANVTDSAGRPMASEFEGCIGFQLVFERLEQANAFSRGRWEVLPIELKEASEAP